MIKPVVLWTDLLIAVVLAAVFAYACYVQREPHLRAQWRKVAASGAGMAGATVLVAFAAVAVLDSLHYRALLPAKDAKATNTYSVDVRSALDALLSGQRTRQERTYSAPFATHAYSKETTDAKETVDTKAGVRRDYPRLAHGGAHLKDVDDRGRDIAMRLLPAWALALVLWWGVAGLFTAASARSAGVHANVQWVRIWRGETEVAWRAVFVTLAALAAIVFPAFALSGVYHVMGTDKVGQDVFYLSLKSIRTALVIGGLTTLVALPIGIFAGIAAGYFKGWVDDVITYIYTTLNSIPSVLLIAAAMLLLQVYIETNQQAFPSTAERADFRLLVLCVILGLTAWTGLARLLRGEALKLRDLEYVQAARAFGVTHGRIITRHLLPNVFHIVLIFMVMEFSGLVLAEAVLSYVGVGVDPTMNSFGMMINTARLEMAREPMVWWSLAAAFVFMFVLVLAANLFADAVRDAFDPRAAVGSIQRRRRLKLGRT